jgi:hypothetical protein
VPNLLALLIDEGENQEWLGVSKPDHNLHCLTIVEESAVSDLPTPATLQRHQWLSEQIVGAKVQVTMTLVIIRAGVENGGGVCGETLPLTGGT